jgi:hypothetical protein
MNNVHEAIAVHICYRKSLPPEAVPGKSTPNILKPQIVRMADLKIARIKNSLLSEQRKEKDYQH